MAKKSGPKQVAVGNYIAQAYGPGANAYVNVYEIARPSPVDEITLAEAVLKLSTLPLETVPDPSPPPQGSRVVFSQNPLFVGREQDLKALASTFKRGKIASVSGMGGIGKTQLASEFLHRYGQFFAGGGYWLSFADPQAVPAEIVACGEPGEEGLDFETRIRLVLSRWQSPLPRLLVFDNCEDENLLNKWRPPSGGCRVLVTSRRAPWNPSLAVQALPLGLLSREESIALLHKHRPDLTEAEADAIAKELDDLPLALTLAGSFLHHYRNAVTPAAYLTQLRDKSLLEHPSLQGKGTDWSPTGHEVNIGRTFALSFDKLDQNDPIDGFALALLARAACLAPGEPIPRDLLIATMNLPEDDPDVPLQAEDALARLARFGLMADAGGSLSIHRLLQLFVCKVNPDPQAGEVVEEVLYNIATRLTNAGYSRPLVAWQPHLRFMTDQSLQRQDERSAGLCNTLGYHLLLTGDYPGARPYCEQALAINRKVLGEDHAATALTLNSMGTLLYNMGDLEAARQYFEQALAINRKVLGEEHPHTALTLNNMGTLLHFMGDRKAARPYYEQALAIRRNLFGEEHPHTATTLNNLGGLLYDMGDRKAARQYFEQALAIRRKLLGEEHQETAISLYWIGVSLSKSTDLNGARSHLQQAVRIFTSTLGSTHPTTQKCQMMLDKLNGKIVARCLQFFRLKVFNRLLFRR